MIPILYVCVCSRVTGNVGRSRRTASLPLILILLRIQPCPARPTCTSASSGFPDFWRPCSCSASLCHGLTVSPATLPLVHEVLISDLSTGLEQDKLQSLLFGFSFLSSWLCPKLNFLFPYFQLTTVVQSWGDRRGVQLPSFIWQCVGYTGIQSPNTACWAQIIQDIFDFCWKIGTTHKELLHRPPKGPFKENFQSIHDL